MKNLVSYLVTALVDHPAQVQIQEKVTDSHLLYAVTVAQSDLGKVIGKRGRTAKALRILLSTFGQHQNKTVDLEIHEPIAA